MSNSPRADRPAALPVRFDEIPAELRDRDRWVLWRYAWRDGKWTKPPFTPAGLSADSTDPNTWSSFDTVRQTYLAGGWDGIGFVHLPEDNLVGGDADKCRDPITGALKGNDAAALLDLDTYTEVSPSATGIRAYAFGRKPGRRCKRGSFEFYDGLTAKEVPGGRYLTVTGHRLNISPTTINARQDVIDGVYHRYFGNGKKTNGKTTTGQVKQSSPTMKVKTARACPLPLSEDELARWRCISPDVQDRIISLWNGDTSGHKSQSEADGALCKYLAVLTNGGRERIEELMTASGLGKREKWTERPNYREGTIDLVLADFQPWDPDPARTRADNPSDAAGTPHAEQTPPNADPKGEQPSNDRDSRDGFQSSPAPLPEMPPAEPFPIALFPPAVADYWCAAAESLHVPVDYIAVPALPLLGATVGRARAASVKRTYQEPAMLWCVLVAPPGRAKSPALRFARGPLPTHTRKWREQHRQEAARHQTELALYEKEFNDWKKNPKGKDAPKKPDRPALTQLVIDKFTVEALVRINADNPRGVCLAADELAALVTGLGQYKGGKGDDRQVMLSLWAGAEAETNRVKDKDKDACGLPLYIAHPFCGVAGMIQPDVLPLLRGDYARSEFVNDGWADRFLLSYPDPPPLTGETWVTVPEDLEKGYAGVFDRLFAMEMVAEIGPDMVSHPRPYYLPFDNGAMFAWQEFTDGIARKANELDRTDNYIGVLSKLKHYGLRLTTLVHCLRAACGEVGDEAAVDEEAVRRAAALVDYFEAHGKRCLGVGWADRTVRIARRLLAWLGRERTRAGFNRTEAFLALKDRRDVKNAEGLGPAFRLLVDHAYILPLGRPENLRPGPIPETYTVNPRWDRKL